MKVTLPFTPIQYIIGKTEFCGLDFEVDDNVLIPRPETEMLVETAIDISNAVRCTQHAVRILDLCTGSGCIAISLFVRLTQGLTNCIISASDVSEAALGVAKRNAILHNVSGKISFIHSDLFGAISGLYNIIVSNPPYIAGHEFGKLPKEVLREPHNALLGGEDGLDFYRRIADNAGPFLAKGGFLVLEIGYGQRLAVDEILKSRNFFVMDVKKDFNGIDRVVIAQKTGIDG